MSHLTLPGLFMSADPSLVKPENNPPSIARLFCFLVAPLSMLPPLMYVYAQLKYPGMVFPLLEPALTLSEAAAVGFGFFAAELAAVWLMANYIADLSESLGVEVGQGDAYAFAATAPVPLWLASLSLLLPNIAINVIFLGIAWLASVAIIRSETSTLFAAESEILQQRLAITLTGMGIMTWCGLMLLLAMLMSITLGVR